MSNVEVYSKDNFENKFFKDVLKGDKILNNEIVNDCKDEENDKKIDNVMNEFNCILKSFFSEVSIILIIYFLFSSRREFRR